MSYLLKLGLFSRMQWWMIKKSVAATESRSQQRAARVKDHQQATQRLRHVLFHRLEWGSGNYAQHSHPVLWLGGLAKKGNFSKEVMAVLVCLRSVCWLGSFNCCTIMPIWQTGWTCCACLSKQCRHLGHTRISHSLWLWRSCETFELGNGWGSLFVNTIRSATKAIPALTARQRVTLWAEDNDIQASHQKLVDAHRALQENRSIAAASKKVEVVALPCSLPAFPYWTTSWVAESFRNSLVTSWF